MSEGDTTGAPGRPVRGILLAHGAMAEGMADAVRRIAGIPEGALTPLSNEGLGPDDLRARVDQLVGPGTAIIFTDLQAGSCTMAARLACGREETRAVVCGVNLPMLLDFVFHRELPLEELVPRLLRKGREAMACYPHPETAPP